MHDDSRFDILGRPLSASRKTGKKKAKRKGAKKKGQRKSAVGTADSTKRSRKGTRKAGPGGSKSKKGVAKKRQPSKKVGKRASKKLGSRKAGATKKRKVLSKTRTDVSKAKKKGAAKPAKSKLRKGAKKAPKRKKTAVKRKTAAVPKKRTRKTAARAQAPSSKKKKRAVAKKRTAAKKRKPIYVRGEILIDETPELIIRERGEIVSPKEFTRPGHAQVSRRLAPGIYFVDVRDFDNYSEDDGGEEVDRYTTSTGGMHMHNDNYLSLFKQAFFDYMKRTRFEDVDDIPIYRFGLLVRSIKPRSSEAMARLVVQFTEFLKDMLPRGAAAHIIDEGKYISVRLGLGRYRQPTTFSHAYDYMARNRELILQFKRGILDYLEDALWFEFWDTEENYAES